MYQLVFWCRNEFETDRGDEERATNQLFPVVNTNGSFRSPKSTKYDQYSFVTFIIVFMYSEGGGLGLEYFSSEKFWL